MHAPPHVSERFAWSSVVLVASANVGALLIQLPAQSILEMYPLSLASPVWIRASAGVVTYLCLVSSARVFRRILLSLGYTALTLWLLSRDYLMTAMHGAVRTLGAGGTGDAEFVDYCFSGLKQWNSLVTVLQLGWILLFGAFAMVIARATAAKAPNGFRDQGAYTARRNQFSVGELLVFVGVIGAAIVLARRLEPYDGWYVRVLKGMVANTGTGLIPLTAEAAFSALLIAASSYFLIVKARPLSSPRHVACSFVFIIVAALPVGAGIERASQALWVRSVPSVVRGFYWDSVLADTICPPLVVLFSAMVLTVGDSVFCRKTRRCKNRG